MPTERITFTGQSGQTLAARLDRPEGPQLATALFAHCFTCSKDIPAARRIAARLAAMGIAVLRFDFTGLGHSEGEFANTSFATNVEDLVAAARYLAERDMAPSLLIGHSLGGAAVLQACADIPSARAVVTLGAPAEPAHVTHHFTESLPDIERDGSAEVCLGGRPFRIGKGFLDALEPGRLKAAIGSLNAALLVLHGPRDETVGIENAGEIFQAAKHPKSFVTLDDADHLITRACDAEYAADVIAAWVGRYVDLSPPAPPPGAPEGIVRVSEADAEGFLQDVQAGPDHHMLADEPRAYGGTDRGPSPYGYLAGGLGACTSMTIRMYARRKGWALSHVSVDVSHAKVHAQDADTGSNGRIDLFRRLIRLEGDLDAHTGSNGRIDLFRRLIRLEGDLDAQQRSRLLEIADKCPVHRTLEHGAQVETVLVDA